MKTVEAPPANQGALPIPAPLENEIEQALESLIGPEKAGKARAVITGVLEKHEFFEGPVPPPALLRQYEEIVPGSAERMLIMAERQLSMAERQLDHEISWEQTSINTQSINSTLGLKYGFVIGLLLIVGAVICALVGQKEVALGLVGASALGLVPTFINAWKRSHSVKREHEPEAHQSQKQDVKKK